MKKYYKKPYRVRKRKSILKNRFFWLGILFLSAASGIFYLLLFSGIFQIKNINITGGEKILKEDIKSLVPGGNIFSVDAEKIRKDILDKFPKIAEVEIHTKFFNTLNILVKERQPAAVWCENDKCFLIDRAGLIFEEVSTSTDLIRITGLKEMLNKERISQILDIQSKLRDASGVTTTQAFIAAEKRLNIKTFEGWEIYFNSDGDLDWQLQELSLVLEKQIPPEKRRNLEYIDLRFSRVYYK